MIASPVWRWMVAPFRPQEVQRAPARSLSFEAPQSDGREPYLTRTAEARLAGPDFTQG
jgi:hypothetical protein